MRRTVLISSLLAVSLSCAACAKVEEKNAITPKAETIVYKVSAGVPDAHFEIAALKKFEKYVEEQTNGSIDVQIFPNNQLGDDKEALELIQQGVIQMCPSGTSALSNFEKSFNILSSPYLFKSQEDIDNILGGEWGQELLATLDKQGFIGLGYGCLGFTNMSNNIRPIEKVEDLKGLKIRCVQNPVLLDFYKTIGASPVSMSFGEVFAALQQGVIDGQFNPLTTIYSNNLQEVQKYISKTNDIASLVVFTVGKDAFNGLTEEQQTAIKEGITIASEYMAESLAQEDADAEKALLETGKVAINDVSYEVKEELFKKGYDVIEKYGNEVNADLFGKLKAELEL